MFTQQTLDADGSCQKVVNGWIVQSAACVCTVATGSSPRLLLIAVPLNMAPGVVEPQLACAHFRVANG
jgi:hypothetical protein